MSKQKICLLLFLMGLSLLWQSCDCDCPTEPEGTPTPLPPTLTPTLTPTIQPPETGTPIPSLTPTQTPTAIPELRIEPSYALVPVGNSHGFSAIGGVSPYYWYLEDNSFGTLQVNNNLVTFTAGQKTGSVHLYAVDSRGDSASALIIVMQANSEKT